MHTKNDYSAEEIEKGRWLFAQECNFAVGAAEINQIPMLDLPEIAFAGRSNVGKSSLINALTGRKTLVRVSHTPGRTQQLNFFNLGEKLMLVDLPGYGYAKVSKGKKLNWEGLIRDYLRGSPKLRRILILIDSRHGVKDTDEAIMTMLDEVAVSYQIIYTKCDKLKKGELPPFKIDREKHAALMEEFYLTSSDEKIGIAELRADLAKIAESK